MSIPEKPQFYQKKDFKTDKLKEMYGTMPSKRDLRRFNRYMNSEQGQKDWLAHEDSESQKYMQSWEDRIAASHAKAKAMMATQNETPAPAAAPAPVQAPTQTAVKKQVVEKPEVKPTLMPKADRWNAEAQKYGFKDMDAVKAWQAENGLVADGKFGKNSLAKYNEIAQANQQAAATNQQTIKANPVAATPQTPAPVMSLDEFRNHKNFRNHYGFRENASLTIEGKNYPIMVSTGTYSPGSKDLYNDHTYAYDPETGLVRAVDESFIGVPNQRWKSGSDWVDWNKSFGLKQKHGGIMNRINYFQLGGAAPQQDIQKQVIQLVQAAMSGNQKANETVNEIIKAAKAGDQEAAQIARMIQTVAQQMQSQATSAKWGSKLNYIKSLKYAKGGKACPDCETKKKVEEKACGGKAKKRYFGGWL